MGDPGNDCQMSIGLGFEGEWLNESLSAFEWSNELLHGVGGASSRILDEFLDSLDPSPYLMTMEPSTEFCSAQIQTQQDEIHGPPRTALETRVGSHTHTDAGVVHNLSTHDLQKAVSFDGSEFARDYNALDWRCLNPHQASHNSRLRELFEDTTYSPNILNYESRPPVLPINTRKSYDPDGHRLRKRGAKFKRSSVAVLEEWIHAHLDDLYPSQEVKEQLAQSSGLTVKQVSSWLSNFRKRRLPSSRYDGTITSGELSNNIENTVPKSPRQMSPMEFWLSSSDDEPASLEDICQSLANNISQTSSYAGSVSGSSAGSAFSQCSEAVWTGPPRRGRKRKWQRSKLIRDRSCTTRGLRYDSANERSTKPYNSSSNEIRDPFDDFINPDIFHSLDESDSGVSAKNDTYIVSTDQNSSREEIQPDIMKPMVPPKFQCTFCHMALSSKAWKRHEETQHLPHEQWVCMLDGFERYSWGNTRACILCNDFAIHSDHAESCHYRIADCLQRSAPDRSYDRKDLLKQHLRNFHQVDFSDWKLLRWRKNVTRQDQQWTCGLCGVLLDNWSTRATHIAQHFRAGMTMASWDSNRTSSS